jgi:tetratricopeptide (TPR) repeat protein
MTLVFGPRPAKEGIARCEAMLTEAPGRWVEGHLLLALGALRFLTGETALGRELCARGHEVLNELGMRLWSAGSVNISAIGAMAGGDLETAERLFRWGIAELEDMDEQAWSGAARLSLARVLCERGGYEEAEALYLHALAAWGKDDSNVMIVGGGAFARVQASRGKFDEALDLARGAVARAEQTDALLLRGDAWWDLAAVARQAGNAEDADDALRRSLAIYEQKGMTVAASRARDLLAP